MPARIRRRAAADVPLGPPRPPRPLHNTALLSGAALAAKGCGFLLLLVALRTLSARGFGQYSQVFALVGLFNVATDMGLSTLAVRDAAQDRALLPRYVANVLALRVALALLSAAVCVALSFVLGYDATVRAGILLWGLALVPAAVVGAMSIAFQAVERLAPLSALTAAVAAATAILGIVALLLGGRVVALVATAAAVNLAAAPVALVLAARVVPPRPRVDLAWWPTLLRAALPFAVLTLLNTLYYRADAVLVYTIKGAHDAGLYGVAYRLIDTLLVVAITPFNAAVLPAFNRIVTTSHEALRRLVVSGTRITLALGVPVSVAATFYARDVLTIVAGKPEYLAAVPALQWLAWAFPCFTVLAILYNALYAVHRARSVGAIFGVTLVCNVALNLLLIPRYGYVASAALTTASEVLNVVLAAWAVHRHVGPLAAGAATARVAAAALAMAAVLWITRPLGPTADLLVGLPAGALVYLAALRALRVVGPAEQAILARAPLVGRYARRL